jgi:hypothetical protein
MSVTGRERGSGGCAALIKKILCHFRNIVWAII